MNEDLKRIKKKYGEKMMHFCRAHFSSVLETEGLLPKILESKFVPSRTLYDDINDCQNEFVNIIMKEAKPKEDGLVETTKTAKELLSDAGYDLYECHSEEDIQSFKKYYSSGEELCTFGGGRLNSCIVFFAVKKNVDEIKREDFLNPERQDEYGTSVISIQFNRNNHYLSIKNRYNHTVSNPDATFSNNLENIIPGLTSAFENNYNLKIKFANNSEIPGYVLASNNRYYKNNLEENNIVYTPNNIIIDNGEVKTYDKELYTVFDYFVLDKKNKKISLYDERLDDSLIDVIGEIDRIEERKQGEEKEITITNKKEEITTIKLDKTNRIVEFTNNYVKDIGYGFLRYCDKLKKINVPNAESVGGDFARNSQVEEFNAPKLRVARPGFMKYNYSLRVLETPVLETACDDFAFNSQVEEFITPKLRVAGRGFMCNNKSLRVLKTPVLESARYDFARDSQVEEFIAPKLRVAGRGFMEYNKSLRVLKTPVLETAESCFAFNSHVEEFNAPKLRVAGWGFMCNNKSLRVLKTPVLEIAGIDFARNSQVEEFSAFELRETGASFMAENTSLRVLETPVLETAENCFAFNSQVEEFNAPKLRVAGWGFMCNNKSLRVLETPVLETARDGFACNSQVEEFNSPKLRVAGRGFMRDNKSLRVLVVSKDCDTTHLSSDIESKIKKSHLQSAISYLNISLISDLIGRFTMKKQPEPVEKGEEGSRRTK